ncbi:RNA exonuclease 4 [Biomphalaria pfeifferi]|uniref:RNA exonuclease 4 n=1 Tax=Biomphalaria pfeifferi TaxID=112525 RepID=A0AAD8C8G7_BIOPF|nr:RNA exonuclease 4 [Biomphalaria pfeifferi]
MEEEGPDTGSPLFPTDGGKETYKDVLLSPELDKTHQKELDLLLQRFDKVLTERPDRKDLIEHEIRLIDDNPVRQSMYLTPFAMRETIEKENKVIIGHAVYNDFKVLGLKPQHYMVRDTAQCRRLVQMASLEGRGNSLKKLAQVLLDRPIQVSSKGHCSVEDARATLDLFKLVRKDWEYDLMVKWLKKNSDINNILMEQVNTNILNASVQTLEYFLQDKFWPTEIID